jgi:SAM-dependent methyltransferase
MPNPHAVTNAPSAWVVDHADLVAVGAARGAGILDLACGGGRHGRLFQAQGHRVCYLDRDLSGVEDLRGAAGSELIQADLEAGGPFPLVGRSFGAVIVVNYLWRAILPDILACVAPGGVLLYETFMEGNEAFGRPRNPDFLLRAGELRDLAEAHGFTVVDFHEGRVEDPKPAMKQHLAARQG